MEDTVREIKENGGKCCSYYCDITNREEVYKTAKAVQIEVGDVSRPLRVKSRQNQLVVQGHRGAIPPPYRSDPHHCRLFEHTYRHAHSVPESGLRRPLKFNPTVKSFPRETDNN